MQPKVSANSGIVRVLNNDDGSFVALGSDGLVLKVVLSCNSSGLMPNNSPEMLVDRETMALMMLSGLQGVQEFVERVSPTSFKSAYIDGVTLKEHGPGLPSHYFDEVLSIISSCEDKGVYRLGLNRHNFMVTPELRPVLLDFGNVLFKNDNPAKSCLLLNHAVSSSRSRIEMLRKEYVK